MPTTNTVKTVGVTAVPFFARFLEKQAPAQRESISTRKFPSDFEDY